MSIIWSKIENAPNIFTDSGNIQIQQNKPNMNKNLENTNTIHIDHIRIVSIIWSKKEMAPNIVMNWENIKFIKPNLT